MDDDLPIVDKDVILVSAQYGPDVVVVTGLIDGEVQGLIQESGHHPGVPHLGVDTQQGDALETTALQLIS